MIDEYPLYISNFPVGTVTLELEAYLRNHYDHIANVNIIKERKPKAVVCFLDESERDRAYNTLAEQYFKSNQLQVALTLYDLEQQDVDQVDYQALYEQQEKERKKQAKLKIQREMQRFTSPHDVRADNEEFMKNRPFEYGIERKMYGSVLVDIYRDGPYDFYGVN
eukprot:TRINITY_DN1805_c0_g1_i3.p1 TRINITY_DN1805_c0_g1~~TRINITY_DN1805_c0_g1_i3.p1  ORF type:complete len:165 (-),score=31.13 TRINITY_DN1805_c0_g1_i3:19-513(-)